MRKLLALLAMLAASVVVVPASQAITDGVPDSSNDYSFVGLMVAKDGGGNPMGRCSGTMLNDEWFLTAGHCVEAPAAQIEIWFRNGYPNQIGAADGYPFTGDAHGVPVTDPDYFFPYRDVGLVHLTSPYARSEYGQLPSLNQLDSLKTQRGQQNVTFDAVGYGLQMSYPDAASFLEHNVKTRMVAHPKLNQINVPGLVADFSLLLSNNANTGGTCFGDSGGPNFLAGTNTVAGVTSFGINGNCAGTGGVFRMDRSWALDFVNDAMEE